MKRVFSCVVAASLALSLLVGCGASSTASSAASSAASSEAASSVASSAAETAALPDGVYTAEFDTDSSMFHANEACDGKGTLTVENGQMTFHVSLASTHIVNLYLGKASDAADHEADWLQPTTDTVTYSDGTSEEVYGFDIPQRLPHSVRDVDDVQVLPVSGHARSPFPYAKAIVAHLRRREKCGRGAKKQAEPSPLRKVLPAFFL